MGSTPTSTLIPTSPTDVNCALRHAGSRLPSHRAAPLLVRPRQAVEHCRSLPCCSPAAQTAVRRAVWRADTSVTVQGYEALEIMEKTKGPNGDTSAAKRLCGAPRSADSGVGPRNHLLISGRGEELPPEQSHTSPRPANPAFFSLSSVLGNSARLPQSVKMDCSASPSEPSPRGTAPSRARVRAAAALARGRGSAPNATANRSMANTSACSAAELLTVALRI
jgi:hypothetical protein